MDVRIIGISSSLDLETGKSAGSMLLRLPDDNTLQVAIDAEVLTHIQGLLGTVEPISAVRPVVADSVDEVTPYLPLPNKPEEVHIAPDPPLQNVGEILWDKLPASVLSDTVKEAFSALGVKEALTRDQLLTTIKEVRSLAIEQTQSTAPATGEVVWSDTPPTNQKAGVPIKFPQKSEYGYPTRPANLVVGSDPGEVVDADEDGVGQG